MNAAKMSLGLLLAFACAAYADDARRAEISPAYLAECAGCHAAFPPALLPAGEWRRVMAALDRHYGDNASLDEKTRRRIEDFLVRNAGGSDGAPAATAALPRLTASAAFQREHREVPRTLWRDARVKSAANCAACHSRAAEGSYREREIVLPGGRRREDD